ncbi:regulatory protein RecX [Psychrobacter sp. FDAARGOS_221]|uniref:regulatory protein RecX n=1 Tax=Psychrobacter sp. FDAARGOS_221 TaxID=1975705 RepID=UPI000BB53119|nr:regulatory protein RecX [Psychrobacter sp. FDAARGOS_221]PNK61187.1 regulatory protein RecX [Psychrobacter sp. FDAARGOS_221]
MEIKTLAQILAENSDKPTKQNKPNKQQQTSNKSNNTDNNNRNPWANKRPDNRANKKPNKKAVKSSQQTGQSEQQQYSTNKKNWAHSSAARRRAASHLSDDPYTSLNTTTDNLDSLDNLDNLDNTDSNSAEDFTLGTAISSTANGKRRKSKRKKQFHPASPYQPKIELTEPVKEVDPNSIKSLLAQVKAEAEAEQNAELDSTISSESESQPTTASSSVDNNSTDSSVDNSIDNLPQALKAYLKTPEQREAEKEAIKAESRLRWLAFYYLSRREHSAQELKDKLIAKDQDPERIDALLEEFREKGYQSDYRTAIMLIREGIRKRYGRVRIKNDFYKRKVDMPTNIDELIDMAMDDNKAFVDVVSDNDLVEGVDWLRLAVEARVKKYGDEIPTDQKIKARQLRFLQYRGFKPNICFEAIKYNLQTLDERF